MLKLGFHDDFVSLIMRCVTSVSMTVKVNGVLTDGFSPSRGIRQGDPISPYLFLLCSEGLSCLLKSTGPMYLSRGVRVGVHAPWISHLLFADDCIVFSEASQRGARRLQEILDVYSRGSGQLVNRDKAAVFFSRNSSDQMKAEVRQTLNIAQEALAERYLGLPTALGRSSSEAFEYLPTRVSKVIGTWSGREASFAGREVLLKSVAQAMPTYTMSCFLLSKTTCRKLKTPIANYWWGGSARSKHIHWQSWDRLTVPKELGGMGFRDMRNFNLAMLGKQGWRLMTNPDSLCARVLKGRYFHDVDFLNCTRKKHSSHTWRAILAGREVLSQGLIKRIGDGSSTNIWRDRWIPKHFGGKPLTPGDGQDVTTVSELLLPGGQWDVAAIRQRFIQVDVDAILRVPATVQGNDVWAWEPEKHGVYSVRSAYRLLDQRRIRNMPSPEASVSGTEIWKANWKLKVPPKIQVFWWRVMHDFLPSKHTLHRRHVEPMAQCEVCGADEETVKHVLCDCTIAKAFWDHVKALSGIKLPVLHPLSWAQDLAYGRVVSVEHQSMIIIGMYSLWMQRNRRRHGEQLPPVRDAVSWSVDMAFDLWQISSEQQRPSNAPCAAMEATV